MTQALPPEPEFGAPLPAPTRSDEVLRFLALRRSASAAALRAPGPSGEQLAQLLRLAARVPDHGKLAPWRFIILEGEAKAAFVGAVEALAARSAEPEKALGALFKLKAPPMGVVVVSRFIEGKIPEWEQRLSSAAVALSLLNAAQAMGFGGNWITDWYAYDPEATAVLGLGPDEQVAGFVQLGAPTEAPMERMRPDIAGITSVWSE